MPALLVRVLLIALLPFALAAAHSGPALAAKRVALVIGNNAYDNVIPLQKAVNDAEAMARTLQGTGFDVTRVLDASRRKLNFAVQGFVNQIEPGDVAMVFFAGHGVEIRGENFLLPTDVPNAAPGQEDFVTGEAISLNSILDRLKRKKAQLNIVILDACRNNPFQKSSGRSLGSSRGLARVNAPKGTFVMYSADAGEEALDRLDDNDPNPNSVFTRTLIPMLEEPGVNLVTLARETRRRVRRLARKVSHEQTPAYYDAVLGDFHFTPGANKPKPPVAPPPSVPPAAAGSIEKDYKLVENIGTKLAWDAFLEKYADRPGSFYVQLAKAALKKLAVGITPPQSPKPQPPKQQPPEPQPPKIQPPVEPPHRVEEVTRSPRVIPVGKRPEGLAWDGRFYWIAESGQRQLSWVDPRSGRVRGRSKVGRLPVDIYATSGGTIYSTIVTDDKIWVQGGPRKKGRTFTRLKQYAQRMTGDDRTMWVLNWINGSSAQAQVTRIDIRSKRKTRSVILPGGALDMAVNDKAVLTLHPGPGQSRILVLHKETLQQLAEATVPVFTHRIAADTRNVYIAGGGFNGTPAVAVRISGQTGKEAGRHEFASQPQAIATDGQYVAVAEADGIISVIDANSFQMLRKIRLTSGAWGQQNILINGNTLALTSHRGQGQKGSLLLVDDWRPL